MKKNPAEMVEKKECSLQFRRIVLDFFLDML